MRNLIVLFVLISFLFGANMARADRQPEEVFKGRVLVSEKRFPMTARSSSAYIDQLNKNSTDRIETDKNTGDCNFYFIAFFLQPAKQIQVNLILTEVTENRPGKKITQELFLDKVGERTMVSSIRLKKQEIQPNTRYQLTIDEGGQILARGQVFILGQSAKNRGKVNFNEEGSSAE